MSFNIPRRYVGMADSELIDSIVEIKDFSDWLDSTAEWQTSTGKCFEHIIGSILLISSEVELARIYCISYILSHMMQDELESFCDTYKIKIPSHLGEKTPAMLRHRILSKYYLPNVYVELNERIKHYVEKNMPVMLLKYTTFQQKYDNAISHLLINFIGDNTQSHVMLYFWSQAIQETTFARSIMSRFDADMWALYETDIFDTFATQQIHKLKGPKMAYILELHKIDKDVKLLRSQYENEQKISRSLREQLLISNQSEKKLKTKIYEQNIIHEVEIADRDKEIQTLNELLEEQDRALNDQSIEIHTLQENLKENIGTHKGYSPLEGSVICVVGHPRRKMFYKQVIEKYGGEFEFVASEGEANLKLIEGPLKRADIVMYLTTFTNHTISNRVKSCTEDSKVVYLNTGGINTFEQELINQVIPHFQLQTLSS